MNRNSPGKVIRNISREVTRWRGLLIPGQRQAPRKRRRKARRKSPR